MIYLNGRVRVKTFQHPDWLTNTYLVETLHSPLVRLLFDAGALPNYFEIKPGAVSAIFITHDDYDHIDKLDGWNGSPIFAHTQAQVSGLSDVKRLTGGETFLFGELVVRVLATPGHSLDHLSFVLDAVDCNTPILFSGDLLFKGSVGGSLRCNFATLQTSIEKILTNLPQDTILMPGHSEVSTLGTEIARNPFIRGWRNGEYISEAAIFRGRPATIKVRARDYDGDLKLLIELEDGSSHTVAGDAVTTA